MLTPTVPKINFKEEIRKLKVILEQIESSTNNNNENEEAHVHHLVRREEINVEGREMDKSLTNLFQTVEKRMNGRQEVESTLKTILGNQNNETTEAAQNTKSQRVKESPILAKTDF